MKKYAIFIPVLFVLLASGCTMFGSNVVNVDSTSQAMGSVDVLAVKDITTLPASPITTDSDVILSFVVENQDTDTSVKTIDNMKIDLFDPSLFTIKEYPPECIQSGCSLLPGEQKYIDFKLEAPSEESIGSITQKDATLNFKTSYDFETETTFTVPVVTMSEVLSLQRAGKTVTISSPKYYSSGPVRADIELSGQDYIIAGRRGTFIIQFKNTGSNNIKNNKIAAEKIEIYFPKDFKIIDYPNSNTENEKNRFFCNRETYENDISCYNTGPVEFYKGKSIPFSFRIETPQENAMKNIPYKTYEIKAKISYTYEIRNTLKVTITPPQS